MTSSLVGSEMCIRDRPMAPPSRGRSFSAGLTPSAGIASAAQSSVFSVSYTHLTLPTICSV
eukprot:1798685-Prorocentrum_lima.AAC.1